MSDKIPKSHPSRPHSPQEPESSERPSSPSQVDRASIPSSSTPINPNVPAMMSSVKRDRKRRESEMSNVGQEEQTQSQGPAKRKDMKSEGTQALNDILNLVSECFGPPPTNLTNLNSIAEYCFACLKDRFVQTEYIKTEEIRKIYSLLFESELSEVSNPVCGQPLDPIDPHPAYVFKSLYTCISRLKGNCRDARENYLSQYPEIRNFFEKVPAARRTQELIDAIDKEDPGFKKALKLAPVYAAREVFGTSNVNPTYILYDAENNPAWVFKPATRRLTTDEKKVFLIPDDESGRKIYSSGEPQELSSRIEHAAYCLNYSKSFPIPLTFLVEINGDYGSIQFFVNGQDVDIDSDLLKNKNFSKSLQAMLIFDLLFVNCDRHTGNFLVRRIGERIYSIFAIDHDACLKIGSGHPLKLDYLEYLSGYRFTRGTEELFSPKSINNYIEIVQRLEIPNAKKLSNWFLFIAEKLQNPAGESLKNLAESIMKEYEGRLAYE